MYNPHRGGPICSTKRNQLRQPVPPPGPVGRDESEAPLRPSGFERESGLSTFGAFGVDDHEPSD